MEWFYSRDGQSIGPSSEDEVVSLVRRGLIRPDTLVWREGLETWTAAGDAPGVASMFAKVPPPLPGAGDPDLPSATSLDEDEEFRRDTETRSTEIWNTNQGGPWSRFFARQIDMIIWSMTAVIAVFTTLPFISLNAYVALNGLNEGLFGVLFLIVGTFINAVVISVFGNSLGKKLFGLRARPISPREHQGFVWNLAREFRVWFYGLAVGIPLIALFTMGLNHKEVRANRPARYDRGIAQMDVKPIGSMRRLVGMLIGLALYVGVIALSVFADEMDREARETWSWTNPVTGVEAEMPGGWAMDPPREAEPGTDFFSFSSLDGASSVVFSAERAPGLDLAAYGDAIENVVSDTVTLDGPWMPTGASRYSAITATGRFDDEGYRVTYLLWEVDGRFWRLIALDGLGRSPPEIDQLPIGARLIETTAQ